MASDRQSADWIPSPWTEVPSLDVLESLDPYTGTLASTTDTWTPTSLFKDARSDQNPIVAAGFGLSEMSQDGEDIDTLELARQSAPQLEQTCLPRRRSRYSLRPTLIRDHGLPTDHLLKHSNNDLHTLPLQRWRHSPPEQEPAPLSAIYDALHRDAHETSHSWKETSDGDSVHRLTGPSSVTSLDSGASGSSVRSCSSAHSAVSSSSRSARVTKPRRIRKRGHKSPGVADRKFKCTFCCDTFKHRFDWSRHEKSLHLDLEEWICAPHGALVLRSAQIHCAYCNARDPDLEHLELHNHNACHSDLSAQRCFRRKDHLVQHLRLVHKLDAMPVIDDWRVETMAVVSRCGFCAAVLYTWEERTGHLARHFHAGKTMLDWHGDHGFSPAVAARVRNALPPYLIGAESLALVPFSATNPASIDHFRQISSQINCVAPELLSQPNQEQGQTGSLDNPAVPSTSNQLVASVQELDTVAFADILARHLGQFARRHVLAGVLPTDDMFQRESRRVLYGDEDDSWNTTVADNPDWLRSFREQGGFGEISDI